MKKVFSVVAVTLMPTLLFADNPVEAAPHAEPRPVVSVISLSPEQAKAFAEVRSEYRAKKARLEAEYEALMDTILVEPAKTNVQSTF